jgi:tetratricopeptide (TPR) repeat protein
MSGRTQKEAAVMLKRTIVAGLFVLVLTGISYAGIAASEAIGYYNEGVRAQKSGNSQGALIAYQKAMMMGITDARYRCYIFNNAAAAYAEQGDMGQAESMLQEALAVNPNYKLANFNMAVIYIRQGLCNKALDYLLRAHDVIGSFAVEEEPVPAPAI